MIYMHAKLEVCSYYQGVYIRVAYMSLLLTHADAVEMEAHLCDRMNA